MTQTLTIALTETEMMLLKKDAALNCRRPQEQARFLLRAVLLNRPSWDVVHEDGLLNVNSRSAQLSTAGATAAVA